MTQTGNQQEDSFLEEIIKEKKKIQEKAETTEKLSMTRIQNIEHDTKEKVKPLYFKS